MIVFLKQICDFGLARIVNSQEEEQSQKASAADTEGKPKKPENFGAPPVSWAQTLADLVASPIFLFLTLFPLSLLFACSRWDSRGS